MGRRGVRKGVGRRGGRVLGIVGKVIGTGRISLSFFTKVGEGGGTGSGVEDAGVEVDSRVEVSRVEVSRVENSEFEVK